MTKSFCVINHLEHPEIEITLLDGDYDIQERVQAFSKRVQGARAKNAIKYAQWSYMRHINHILKESVVRDPVENWTELRNKKSETYVLMEAWPYGKSDDPNSILGLLLLRSGWSGDVAIDYVISTNLRNDGAIIEEVGRKLVWAAIEFTEKFSDKRCSVFVETAIDSTEWWRYLKPRSKELGFLTEGTEFIRYSITNTAKLAISQHLNSISSELVLQSNGRS